MIYYKLHYLSIVREKKNKEEEEKKIANKVE